MAMPVRARALGWLPRGWLRDGMPRHTRTLHTDRDAEGRDRLVVHKDDAVDGEGSKVTVLTLNSPSKLNALTWDMGVDFQQCVKEINAKVEDGSTRAVVLTGAGKAFSAGGDLDWLVERTRRSPEENYATMRAFYAMFLSVRQLRVPVVAAINGPAIGAGLCLACATDIRVASETAKMGMTFASLGLHPGMAATHFLPRVVGPQHATSLLLTGDVISGTQAKTLGLVASTAASGEDSVNEALSLTRRMARQSPVAVQTCVTSLRRGRHMHDGLDDALHQEATMQGISYASPDLKEGIAAVRDKRRPAF